MAKRIIAVTGLALSLVATAGVAQEATHRVTSGDTLWDISAKYWQDPNLWPELWAVNPQLRNPHWIYPGEVIHLTRPERQFVPRRVVRLPLEKLAPATAAAGAAGAGAGAAAASGDGAEAGAHTPSIRLARRESLDYIASHRVRRLGVVDNVHQTKENYAAGEDLEFRVLPDSGLAVGDLVSVFDDATPVVHPVTAEPQGYYVEVLGHLEVLGVVGERGVGRVIESYHAIGDGAGLMPLRRPVPAVELREAQVGVEGAILRGRPESNIFADDDVVFLDRGSLHGLEPGVVLEVPVREGERSAQGAVDLGMPLATLVVVTAEEKTAAGLVVSSRAALESGDRFTAVPFSP